MRRTVEIITRYPEYLDVIPKHVEDRMVFVPSDILKVLEVNYQKILESANTYFLTVVWKHS
jgi:hypothetical protein